MKRQTEKIVALILASGAGERFKEETPKQFAKLAGLPVLVHTLLAFQRHSLIQEIVIVTNSEAIELVRGYTDRYSLDKVLKVVPGGKTRQESSRIGLNNCPEDTSFVLIHDGVRPFISGKIISELVDMVRIHEAVDTVIPSADTVVRLDRDGFIDKIPERSSLRRGQTPQAFEFQLIKKAHRKAVENHVDNTTDDCALVMKLGKRVIAVPGDKQNIKVTYPIDLHIADKLFQLKKGVIPKISESELKENLKNKHAIVLGGSSGIGQALSEMLISLGCGVSVLSRSTNPPCDITNFKDLSNSITGIFEKHKTVDFIINCAGDLIRKPVLETSFEEWDHIYRVNVTGNFLLVKAVLPFLKKQNEGSIIFVGSSSYTRGRSGYAAYSSSKAALINFCQALAEEVNEHNIRVNAVSPGRVATPLRKRNFGCEDEKTLLTADQVAQKIVEAMLEDTTGSIFEI